MCTSQFIQFNLEQNILHVDVGVDEAELGFVLGVLESGTDDLEHGSDSGSTSDHSEFTSQVRGIDEFALGALNLESVSNLEKRHVAGDVAFLIGLGTYEQSVGSKKVVRTLISTSKWPRSSSLLVGV